MSLSKHLIRRGGTYHFRTRVPLQLRTKLGRSELWRSLKTRSPVDAVVLSYHLSALTADLWRAVSRAMTKDEIKTLVDGWLNAQLEREADLRDLSRTRIDDWAVVEDGGPGRAGRVVRTLSEVEFQSLLADRGTEFDSDLPNGQRFRRRGSEAELAKALFDEPWRHALGSWEGDIEDAARPVVRELLAAAGASVDESSAEFDDAVRLMLKAQADLQRGIIARDDANWRRLKHEDPAAQFYAPSNAVLMPRTATLSPAVSPGPQHLPTAAAKVSSMKLSAAAELAINGLSNEATFGPGKRRNDYEAAVRSFVWWNGSDPDLSDITPAVAGRYRVDLPSIPANLTKYRQLEGLAAHEVIVAAKSLREVKYRSADTINNKYLRTLSRIFTWLKSAGLWADADPFTGIAVSRPKGASSKGTRRIFSDTEVVDLLSLPLFTGAEGLSDKRLYKPGDQRVDDWRFWVPLICLFSGMRLNEACGLALVDIKHKDGISYFHVRDTGDEQRVKTASSIRTVPVHHALIEAGLLRKVAQLRSKGARRLFPELLADPSGYLSTNPSKWLNRLIDRIEDQESDVTGKLTFHSSRHTVITKLRTAGVRQDVSEAVVGHESSESSVHAGYGTVELTAARDAINKIAYKGAVIGSLRQPYATDL